MNKLRNCEDPKCICNKPTDNMNPKCMWCGGKNPPAEEGISLDYGAGFVTVFDTVQLCLHCWKVGIQRLFFFMIENKMFPKIFHTPCDWNKSMWPEEGCKSKHPLKQRCACDVEKEIRDSEKETGFIFKEDKVHPLVLNSVLDLLKDLDSLDRRFKRDKSCS